ncbi:MAG: PKD domain-containing protein [Candidatus Dadabacteria bacterium]|nr:PKD domain-containing protein [Candidatus Dadabacteria bacterium]
MNRIITFTGCVILVWLVFGCSKEPSSGSGNILSSHLGSSSTIPENPLGDRTNPLLTYIRTNWTDNDGTNTGGLHYSHIKVFGANWNTISWFPNADINAEFIVDNFDAYMWGGPIVGEHASGQYDDFLWIHCGSSIPYILPGWDSLEVINWMADSTLNTEGYGWEDIVMHFKYDGTNIYGNYLGWNPNDDLDLDGCRDGLEPSDSNRTAECIGESEILFCEYPSANPWWYHAKVIHPGRLKMTSDRLLSYVNDQDYDFSGYFWDSCAFNIGVDMGLQNSFLYEGVDMVSCNLDYYLDKFLFVPTIAANYLEPVEPALNIHFANMVSPTYTCTVNDDTKDWAFEYLENIMLECWIMYGYAGISPMTVSKIDDYINCPYLNWLEQGKGQVFTSFVNGDSDIAKRFSLATFYMINHQMAFYYYTEGGHMSSDNPGQLISEWQWNEYTPYDIGQPTVNSFGLQDFQGNYGTNRYFIWENALYYKILGREYLRNDSMRVLVLTKIMADGCAAGINPTVHELPHCYQPVQSDLTLGTPTREVTLKNNEGIILVQDPECMAPPIAEFSANITSGYAPMTVSFSDLSTNVPTSWSWSFGAVGGSYMQNPIFIFTTPGTYTVQLIATNEDGSDSEIKTSFIVVMESGGGGGKPGELPTLP